jgi:hypothetical protein
LYERPSSWLNYSATYYVLSRGYEKWLSRREQEPAPVPAAGVHGDAAGKTDARPRAEPGRDAYQLNKDRYRRNAEPLLQIVRQYFAVLQADHTQCLFVLQPLLLRRGVNKRLSQIERSFTGVLVPGGNAVLGDEALLLSYFYDEFLSSALAETAQKFGIGYLDMNREISHLGPDVELFTDYCHLTPQGNQYVAEILARAIVGRAPAAR